MVEQEQKTVKPEQKSTAHEKQEMQDKQGRQENQGEQKVQGKQKADKKSDGTQKQRKRVHPGIKWGKRLLVPTLCLIALMAGLYVGYVVIGAGDAGDVWKMSTWKHVFDLIFAD
ncbi:DNA-directed RNA polymerase subunit beta [Marinicrinis sediminis]|uniref:DNA-directed RNA polymerase subunit beta n=1 Tax=Marinicrinis sediminis TaxID=1652465 RepID=A0ABW5RCC0_9BACL